MALTALPPYLLLLIPRVTASAFGSQWNGTLVTGAADELDAAPFCADFEQNAFYDPAKDAFRRIDPSEAPSVAALRARVAACEAQWRAWDAEASALGHAPSAALRDRWAALHPDAAHAVEKDALVCAVDDLLALVRRRRALRATYSLQCQVSETRGPSRGSGAGTRPGEAAYSTFVRHPARGAWYVVDGAGARTDETVEEQRQLSAAVAQVWRRREW
jgi:hypothetical protein